MAKKKKVSKKKVTKKKVKTKETYYRFYDIEWEDTYLDLPEEVELKIDDPDFNVNEDGADLLSDKFGSCVEGFRWEKDSL